MSFEITEDEGGLVGISPPERRYFTLVGDREKYREARVELTPIGGGRTRVDVRAELVQGPVGAAKERREDPDEAWLDEFQRAVQQAILARTRVDA